MRIKKVAIHPITERLFLQKKHPWILEDQFTAKFPKDDFLLAVDKRGKDLFYFIHDSDHKKIKGRFWSETDGDFEKELKSRINLALEKRAQLNLKRENYYLIFGESDQLPGLFYQKFSGVGFLQFKTTFWQKYKNLIMESLQENQIYLQDRKRKETPWILIKGDEKNNIKTFKEFEVNYIVKSSDPDIGFYTDMSSVRIKLLEYFQGKVANLFSYTGAFSLFALKNGATEVYSVDLSKKYLNHLEENLSLNHFQGKHFSIKSEVVRWMKQQKADNAFFDFIVCDPPTSSTDGKSKRNNLKLYDEMLPLIFSITKKAVVFCNTHQVSMTKFEKKIREISEQNNLKLKIQKTFKLAEDCPTQKGFPEGDYLKGFLLAKK